MQTTSAADDTLQIRYYSFLLPKNSSFLNYLHNPIFEKVLINKIKNEFDALINISRADVCLSPIMNNLTFIELVYHRQNGENDHENCINYLFYKSHQLFCENKNSKTFFHLNKENNCLLNCQQQQQQQLRSSSAFNKKDKNSKIILLPFAAVFQQAEFNSTTLITTTKTIAIRFKQNLKASFSLYQPNLLIYLKTSSIKFAMELNNLLKPFEIVYEGYGLPVRISFLSLIEDHKVHPNYGLDEFDPKTNSTLVICPPVYLNKNKSTTTTTTATAATVSSRQKQIIMNQRKSSSCNSIKRQNVIPPASVIHKNVCFISTCQSNAAAALHQNHQHLSSIQKNLKNYYNNKLSTTGSSTTTNTTTTTTTTGTTNTTTTETTTPATPPTPPTTPTPPTPTTSPTPKQGPTTTTKNNNKESKTDKLEIKNKKQIIVNPKSAPKGKNTNKNIKKNPKKSPTKTTKGNKTTKRGAAGGGGGGGGRTGTGGKFKGKKNQQAMSSSSPASTATKSPESKLNYPDYYKIKNFKQFYELSMKLKKNYLMDFQNKLILWTDEEFPLDLSVLNQPRVPRISFVVKKGILKEKAIVMDILPQLSRTESSIDGPYQLTMSHSTEYSDSSTTWDSYVSAMDDEMNLQRFSKFTDCYNCYYNNCGKNYKNVYSSRKSRHSLTFVRKFVQNDKVILNVVDDLIVLLLMDEFQEIFNNLLFYRDRALGIILKEIDQWIDELIVKNLQTESEKLFVRNQLVKENVSSIVRELVQHVLVDQLACEDILLLNKNNNDNENNKEEEEEEVEENNENNQKTMPMADNTNNRYMKKTMKQKRSISSHSLNLSSRETILQRVVEEQIEWHELEVLELNNDQVAAVQTMSSGTIPTTATTSFTTTAATATVRTIAMPDTNNDGLPNLQVANVIQPIHVYTATRQRAYRNDNVTNTNRQLPRGDV